LAIVRTESKRDPRLRWFDQARFGMFVHFGIYSQLGRGEWVMYEEDIPRHRYERLAESFNPTEFDAGEWVSLARRAGARYINLTAKHHDGFCLFDTDLTDFKVTNTPFGRDLVGELVEACHREGMPIILYYSQPDWHHPNFVHRKGAFKDLQTEQPDQEPDWPRYQEYVEGQVEELVTGYGRIDGIWFDGSHKSEREWRGKRLYTLIKKHQPRAVVNDRARHGDFFTPERSLPDDLTGYMFEACQSIQVEHWGYAPDSPLYSTSYLLESLIRMAAAGGNYLLNVGPGPDGRIPTGQKERMIQIGDWLRRNGDAIYGTEACKLPGRGDLSTRRDNEVFIHLLSWPERNELEVPGIRNEPTRAHLLGESLRLRAELSDGKLRISGLPPLPPGHGPSVIALHFEGPPDLEMAEPPKREVPMIQLIADGTTRLRARDARLTGRGVKGHRLRLRPASGGNCISGWGALEQAALWKVDSETGGRYRVCIEYSCPEPYAGSTFTLSCRGDELEGEIRPTESFDRFGVYELGSLTIPSGRSDIILQARHMPYAYIFADVKGLKLVADSR